ncbi:hypothetical protein QRD43_03755 [Pelomonas sp. APW6]|uniref:SGNH hydrolase-type esterase domain-containing protein n=1 Tax=Roseateles subflavus TaxID=3053353 RepID=A0ABT7LDS8_9BURK|nr:hypothetical protein [Pelomonas sp. APW6]MDL5031012.1 hypothetical protein [Pelomonas sp. APW6]
MRRAFTHVLPGMLALLAALELTLQALPVSDATMKDYHLDPMVLSYPAGHGWTTSIGWDLRHPQRHQANNAGFLAKHDFTPDAQAVALIGDSLVEASALPAADRPDAQLERALAGPAVYGLGAPGSSLLDHVERLRLAHDRYGIRRFVILLENGDVAQGLCGSGNVQGPCLDRQDLTPRTEQQPPAGAVKRLLRHSALLNYLLGQLKLSGPRLWQQAVKQARPDMSPPAALAAPRAEPPWSAAEQAVTEAFLQRLRPYLADSRVLVAIESRHDALPAGGPAHIARLEGFRARLQEAGIEVLDLAPAFEDAWHRTRLPLEIGPYDHHFNALGVRTLADAIAAKLRTP